MDDLPTDLLARGFWLIPYDDGSLRACSDGWGVSERYATLDEVIAATRRLVSFLEWLGKQEKGQ